MHSFIMIGNDIYPLDTAAERAHAAEHMRDAMLGRCRVYTGEPGGESKPDGRAFFSDGTIAYYVEPVS